MPFGWGKGGGPTPAQKQIGEVLFNDALHVLSSFELNRIASLTYGDDVCDEIFEMLEQVQRRPMEYSILTVQKSLVITKHVLIYGSEKCVNSALALQRGVELLLEFNTVIWAQKLQGAAAVMRRLKGGGVDKGYPVREAAKEVWPLMTDVNKLRQLRNSSADPNSLVPVGNDKIAFLSDDVRHYLLKKRIKEQYELTVKSNLKDQGGFGSGYASRDGKTVVGAAHGLDEMIKQAQRVNNKFSDNENAGTYGIPDLSELTAMAKKENESNYAAANSHSAGGNTQQSMAPIGDLLDFSSEAPAPAASGFEGDLLGGGIGPSGTSDLLGTTSSAYATTDFLGSSSSAPADTIDIFASSPAGSSALHTTGQSAESNGLFDMYSSTTPDSAPDASGLSGDLSLLSLGGESKPEYKETTASPAVDMNESPSTTSNNGKTSSAMASSIMGGSIMSSNVDRFSALDALEIPAAKNSPSLLSAKEAENRLLSHASSMDSPTVNNPHDPLPPTDPPSVDEPESNNSVSAMATHVDNGTTPGFAITPSDVPEVSVASVAAPPVEDSYPAGYSTTSNGGSGIKIAPNMSSLNVSATFGDPNLDDDDGGFVMGGSMGTGLEPTAAAPAAPPPPPPPI